jgi:hypothetical protein
MALKRERERERDGKQKLLCYAKEAGGLPTSRSIYADLQSGAGWRKHGSCLVSSLAARRARGGKSKAETKALSINPHQPRPPLAPHPRISILYFSSRQIISLSLLLRNAGCLVAAHSAISLILALALRSAARFLRALAPCLCTHAKIEMRSSKICLCGREEKREWMQMSPKAQERSGKTFMCASECVSTDLRSSWQERKLFCFAR